MERNSSRLGTSSALEDAMRLFQRACREPLDGNTSFATMPTCFGRNTGQLHNELQFRARTTKKPDDELGSSLIGVGVINVAADGGTSQQQLINASAVRVCRARRLAAALEARFPPDGKAGALEAALEVWQYELDPSLTPSAPRVYTAPIFRSKAHSCVGGGGDKRTDFATEQAAFWNPRRGVWARRRPPPPMLPHASFWGYYFTGRPWTQWSRVRIAEA